MPLYNLVLGTFLVPTPILKYHSSFLAVVRIGGEKIIRQELGRHFLVHITDLSSY